MNYKPTPSFAKTFLVFLLGVPFVLGVFSNTRPNLLNNPYDAYSSRIQQDEHKQEPATLFGHLQLNHNADA